MSKQDPGFFTMRDAADVLKQPSLPEAKAFLLAKVKAFVVAHPLTRADNIAKAEKAIARGTSLDKLSFSVANFVLAHSSEGLKVIK